MTVAQPSTPASHFHLLRRQAYTNPKRPLIIFSPKSMLRLRAAVSSVEDFTQGEFMPLIDDPKVTDPSKIQRALFCSGKVYWDLLAEKEKNNRDDVAIIRLEQLYPTPVDEIKEMAAKYSSAEAVWVQDEPANQGPWTYMGLFLPRYMGGKIMRLVSRPASASPATGSSKTHQAEQKDLIRRAFEDEI